jgi:hypothetical protein
VLPLLLLLLALLLLLLLLLVSTARGKEDIVRDEVSAAIVTDVCEYVYNIIQHARVSYAEQSCCARVHHKGSSKQWALQC